MILRFVVGSVAFHFLYYTLKNTVVPTLFDENIPKVIAAEIAKRSATGYVMGACMYVPIYSATLTKLITLFI